MRENYSYNQILIIKYKRNDQGKFDFWKYWGLNLGPPTLNYILRPYFEIGAR